MKLVTAAAILTAAVVAAVVFLSHTRSISLDVLSSTNANPVTLITDEALWALPTTTTTPRGILVALHGCTHAAEDWFVLPEENRIVRNALRRALVVVAVSSTDRASGCWMDEPDADTNEDYARVVRAVEKVHDYLHVTWGQLPVILVGASSGGTFASLFALLAPPSRKPTGIIVQISPGHPLLLDPDFAATEDPFPPTCFVFMPKDERWASTRNIQRVAAALRRRSQPRVSYYAVSPTPLPADMNHDLLGKWIKANLADAHTRHVLVHPRAWPASAFDGMTPTTKRQVEELVKVAWAEHELTSAFFDECMRDLSAAPPP